MFKCISSSVLIITQADGFVYESAERLEQGLHYNERQITDNRKYKLDSKHNRHCIILE